MRNNISILFTYVQNYSLAITFLSFFFLDFLGKLGDIYILWISGISLSAKLIFQIFIVLTILIGTNKSAKELLYVPMIIFLCYFIGQFFLNTDQSLIERLINNLKILNWYIFIFILKSGYEIVRKVEIVSAKNEYLFQAFEMVFLVNSITILLGLFFKIEIFKCYVWSDRFGYNGFIRNATHASYIYMIFNTYFYYKSLYNPSIRNTWLLILSFLTSCLVATKAIMLFNAGFIFYFLFTQQRYKLLGGFIFIFGGLLVNYKILIETIVKEYFRVLYDVYVQKGILTMLFSLRNESVFEAFYPYILQKWGIINYLFGGAQFDLKRTEFELVDLFWFFGIIGTILFLYFWNKHIFSYQLIWQFKLVMLVFLISLIAGSFFSSVPVMTFLFVLILYLKNPLLLKHNLD